MLVLVMAFWGSAFALSKVAVHDVPPQVASLFRFGLGAVALLVLHSVVVRKRVGGRDLGRIAGIGMIGVFVYNSCFFLGLSLAPSADGSVIIPVCSPVITVAVTALMGRRRLTGRALGGLATAVAGAAVFFVGIPGGGTGRVVGDLLFVAAAGCWATYTVRGAPLLARLPTLTVTTYAAVAGSLGLAVLAVPFFGDVRWSTLDGTFWLNQAYLAALPTALAYVMYYQAVGRVGPATASSMMFLVPVFGLLGSWIVLGEAITPVQAVGAAGMLVGAWFATVRGSERGRGRAITAGHTPAGV